MAQEASTGHWKGQYPWPFGRDPNSSVLRRDVESDRLIGNVSVTYVTLVPWRRERRRHVPSPRLLYHRWAAGPRLGSSAKTWICAAPAAYLCSRCDQRQLDAIIACQCALARLVYTRSGLVSLSDIPIRRSSDVTSPFPPSGNEGYIRNRDDIHLKNDRKPTQCKTGGTQRHGKAWKTENERQRRWEGRQAGMKVKKKNICLSVGGA